ncbi:DUF3365 domain-containing protein [Hymenobacter sp. BT186]|uniref:DUF3365 domain-containing protein n=1 Tax=Hymenobacter telluris TaxID=2816474 RepID=A0A939F2V1_9BACT|nr:DUF3365 domain-containing protein [Hymenobacter telluris]MBO0360353.1 DUF3365 domain-containing protein [Hymenobacter telluris]MBW3376380.1 DUF3365 domain-containing protein [Hymenobacter norwichensis]
MSPVFRRLTATTLLLTGLLSACSSDQIEHIKNGKKIARDLENMTVKRILPADLLRATRWAGDSLTRQADRELRQVLNEKLQAGGVAAALPYCRPETFASVDSLARVLQATARRRTVRPRNPANQAPLTPTDLAPDTARQVARTGADVFTYQRPIVLNDALCLRCHGEVGKDIAPADYALITKQFPQDKATGYRLGQAMGVWQVSMQRTGVAEFYTMKTRKIMKPRKKLF